VSAAVQGRPIATAIAVAVALVATIVPISAQTTAHAYAPPNPETTPEGAASPGPLPVKLTRVAHVTRGTSLAFRPHDPSAYLTRQSGQVVPIRLDGTRARAGAPILDLRQDLGSHREQGLLGIVFSPDGHRMYVYYTSPDGEDTLVEYAVKPGRHGHPVTVDRASKRTLFVLPHPNPTHNGGQLAFGRDRMLYVSVGDGGGKRGDGPGQAPGGNSQSLDNLYGKILRIDPTPSGDRPYSIPPDNPFAHGGGAPEIWQYGLRNPWRFSFDRATNDLWIGDVGQDHWEEIDWLPAGRAGVNFGYPLLEGTHALKASAAPGTVPPVLELWHRAGNCAVTGGYVYRGERVPNLRGMYVYTDYCKGSIKTLRQWQGRIVAYAPLGLHAPLISSFAEAPDGELYVISQARGLLRIDPR
jgi:glucose/arabinose dehydrogenase